MFCLEFILSVNFISIFYIFVSIFQLNSSLYPSYFMHETSCLVFSCSFYKCEVFTPLSILTMLIFKYLSNYFMGFPCSSGGKESAYNAGDPGSILGLGRFHREGNGNALQYSCLQNPTDRGPWQSLAWTEESKRSQRVRHD